MYRSYFRFTSILLGVLLGGLAGFRLWQLWNVPTDTHWLPAHLSVPLDAASDRLEVLLKGDPLLKALGDGRMTVTEKGNAVPVSPRDLTVRINNYDRDRAGQIPEMLAWAALAGAALVLLLVGLFTPLIGAFHQGLVDLNLTTT